MEVFDLTFRLHEDSDYPNRYESVNDAIKNVCHGEYWSRSSSYYLFQNPTSAKQITDWIEANSKFAPSKDMLLVTNLSSKDHSPVGIIETDALLHRIMSKR